jgi:hypothetical protein
MPAIHSAQCVLLLPVVKFCVRCEAQVTRDTLARPLLDTPARLHRTLAHLHLTPVRLRHTRAPPPPDTPALLRHTPAHPHLDTLEHPHRTLALLHMEVGRLLARAWQLRPRSQRLRLCVCLSPCPRPCLCRCPCLCLCPCSCPPCLLSVSVVCVSFSECWLWCWRCSTRWIPRRCAAVCLPPCSRPRRVISLPVARRARVPLHHPACCVGCVQQRPRPATRLLDIPEVGSKQAVAGSACVCVCTGGAHFPRPLASCACELHVRSRCVQRQLDTLLGTLAVCCVCCCGNDSARCCCIPRAA